MKSNSTADASSSSGSPMVATTTATTSTKDDPTNNNTDNNIHKSYSNNDNNSSNRDNISNNGSNDKDEQPCKFAVKIMDRSKLKKADDHALFREVRILHELRDIPHVVRLVDFFVEPKTLYVVLTLATGGDVFDRLVQRKTYTEQFARELAHILLETLNTIHDRNIVHRDIKPGNLLLANETNDCSILLADFGFATHLKAETNYTCRTRCGTPMYVAPEIILDQPYGTKVDMWSCGCILYMLLCGYPPFSGDHYRDLFRKVRAGNFTFHESSWANVSLEAKQLIAHLLTVNPKHRYTAQQALDSAWFQSTTRQELTTNDLSHALSNIRSRRKLKAAMDAVRYATTAKFWTTLPQPTAKDGASSISSSNSSDAGSATSGDGNPSPIPSRTTKKVTRFEDCYKLLRKVGKGSFATIWECQDLGSGEILAVKVIPRPSLSAEHDEQVLNEVSILQSVSGSDTIVKLVDFFEHDDAFYIVMELMMGGDVFDRVLKKSHYSERDARDLIKRLLEAVQELHQKGIAHRDIKPHNLLLPSNKCNSDIKLCDFGFARRVHTPESLIHRVGTPPFVAPEILKNHPHDERVDLWSVGVTSFVLLVGYPPFAHDNREVVCQLIKAGNWKFRTNDWHHISNEAKDLVRGLLQVDPQERWSASEALQSPWFQKSSDSLARRSLQSSATTLKKRRGGLRGKTWTWSTNILKGFVSKPISTPTQAKESLVEEDNSIRDISDDEK